jgi:hypothetical protein
MADRIAKSAKKKGLVFNLEPGALTGLLLITHIVAVAMPTFLYPLSMSIAAIPWLLLHQKMNHLRLAETCEWRQPEDSYTWRQRSVFIVGVPLMAFVLIGSKQEFIRFTSDELDRGENIVGNTSIYQLHIPEKNWRKVPNGTFYPDTDLELMGPSKGEWVVVRTNPNPQQTLDATVDTRKSVIAANLKNYKIAETRTLDSGGSLIPLSLAHYKGKDPLNNHQSLFIATIVTPENIIEAIGQETKSRENGVQSLVESLRLTAKGTKR